MTGAKSLFGNFSEICSSDLEWIEGDEDERGKEKAEEFVELVGTEVGVDVMFGSSDGSTSKMSSSGSAVEFVVFLLGC